MRKILLMLLVLAALAPFLGAISAASAAVSAPDPVKDGEASAHPYAGLDQKAFWQAVERDRRSPTEMPGVTGSLEHPSPHGPKRTGSEVKAGARARAPFDEPEVHCPATGCGFVADVVLVKLDPGMEVVAGTARATFTSDDLNRVLNEQGFDQVEAVFPGAERPPVGTQIVRPDGQVIAAPDLTRWIRLFSDAPRVGGHDVGEIARRLRLVPGVAWAEPDYQYKPQGAPDRQAKGVKAAPGSAVNVNDPLYPQQWQHVGADVAAAWTHLQGLGLPPQGSPNVVVAVIDTGVDYTHPDLAASMWVNQAEFVGAPGVDDDANGYVDDIHGARVLGGDISGDPQDDHGHGTHVAGIVAAQADNGIGGAGVAAGVRIMAIKAAQYSGTLNSSDVARGVVYAVAQGADVLNMSFGGNARSLAVEEALATAFGTAVLVAAAGNDGRENLPCSPGGVNFYPAAYIWVVGVMSRNANPTAGGDYLSTFSNRDCSPADTQEYEVMAPGGGILSTLPQGGHGTWSGTSMAAPVVAGIAALARTKWSDRASYSSRFIMGQIAATGGLLQAYKPNGRPTVSYRQVDAEAVLTVIPQPDPGYLEHWLFDTTSQAPGNDSDGIVDAGETVDLALVIANRWGAASNVQVTIEAQAEGSPLADPYIEWLIDTVGYDSIGAFAIKDNGLIRDAQGAVIGVSAPFRFRAVPGTPNDHVIPFKVTVTAQNAADPGQPPVTKVSRFTLLVQRGRELPRLIASDFTMTKDDYWLVPDGVLVEAGATLRILPGTQVQFFSTDPSDPFYVPPRPQIQVEGTLSVEGSAAEPVEMFTGLLYPAHPIIIRAPTGGIAQIQHARIMNPRLGSFSNYDQPMFLGPLESIEASFFSQQVSECIQTYYWHAVPPHWDINCNASPDIVAFSVSQSRLVGLTGSILPFNANILNHGGTLVLNESLVDRTVLTDAHISASGSVFLRGSYQTPLAKKTIIRPAFSYFPPAFLQGALTMDGHGSRFWLASRDHAGVHARPLQAIGYLQSAHRLAVSLGGAAAWIASAEEDAFVGSNWLPSINQTQFSANHGTMDCGTTLLNGPPSCWSLFAPSGLTLGALALTDSGPLSWLGGQPFEYANFPAEGPGLGRLLRWPWMRTTENRDSPIALRLPPTIGALDFNVARQALIDAGDFGGFSGNAILNDWLSLDSQLLMDVVTDRPRNYVMPIAGNYWGTQSTTLIEAALRDFNDDFNLARIQYQPILTTPPEAAYPFVSNIVIADASGPTGQVGAEDITITVQFNRDMDTSRSLEVSFGPAEPYTDYLIDGDWEDARTWSGNFRISPLTGDGFQYVRVVRGVAAGMSWLITANDVGRFRFEVSTSGAAGINLQAVGAEGRVELSWSQNDYPLLAGYNLYRSTSVDGSYQRINGTTIPQGMTQWTDTAVTPGQPYYYYFTVVLTDLTESPRSNIATATPTDTVAPVIVHTPVHSAEPMLPLTLRANVTDNVSVQSVSLYHRPLGGASYTQRAMVLTTGSEYAATLEGSLTASPGIEYYIEATDGVGIARAGRPEVPLQIIVQDRPTVLSVQPTSGPSGGGTTITITGTNFKVGVVVDVGAGACGSVQRISATQLTCVTPPSFPQVVDVRVRNPDAQQGTLLNAFSYVADTATLGFPAASGGNLQIVQVPLNVAGVQGLTSASVAISFDPAILSARGASAGSLTPGWQVAANTQTPGTVLLSMASSGGAVSGAGSLALIEFDVVGQPGSNTALTISSASFNDGAIPVQTSAGSFSVNPVYSVSGSVLYWSAARPVPATQLRLAGAATYNGTATAQGTFVINGVPADNYALTPEKATAGGEGISAFDASLALRHDAQLATLAGPALTAADVNRNGQVTAQDAFLILQHAAGLTNLPFPGAGQIWFFDPPSRAISGLAANLDGQSFTGVLLGDPSGNWQAGSSAPEGSARSSVRAGTGTTALSIPLANAQPGQVIDVPVTVQPAAGAQVLSADLELNFDPAVLGFVAATAGSVAVNWTAVANHQPSGRLRVAMAGSAPLPSAGTLLVLRFQAVGGAGSQSPLFWQRSELNEGGVPSSATDGSVTVALPIGIFASGFENLQ
jgi:subtilisin family serine protease